MSEHVLPRARARRRRRRRPPGPLEWWALLTCVMSAALMAVGVGCACVRDLPRHDAFVVPDIVAVGLGAWLFTMWWPVLRAWLESDE